MKRYPWIVGLVASVLGAGGVLAQSNLAIIDAHSQFDTKVPNERVIEVIEQAGVSRVLLSSRQGEAVEKRALDLARLRPDLISALLASKWDKYDRPEQFVAGFERRAVTPGFVGMAELLVTHAPHEHEQLEYAGIQLPLDAPQIKAAIRIAQQHGWPLILHLEFVDMGREAAPQYLAALEKLLSENREVSVGLIHMAQLNEPQAAALLAAHPNLFFLTSHADNFSAMGTRKLAEKGMKSQTGWINMFSGQTLSPEWRTLMSRYPDRFVLAFDNVFPPHWSELYSRKVAFWRAALSELPPDAAQKIAHGNAERLWKLPPAGK